MPTPKRNESKQDFLSRCTTELIEKEGRKSDQAYAMCNSYWDEAKAGKRNTLTLSAPVELQAGEGDDPDSFMITAYTGRPVDTWFGRLVFDLKGMKTRETMPILREHMRDRIVGYGNKAWADKQNFYVSGRLSRSTPDAEQILSLAREGFPWQASVGIWPLTIKVLDSEKETETINGQEIRGPAEIWQESLVGEVSFVALGADGDTAAIVLSDQGAEVPVTILHNFKDTEEQTMDFTLENLTKDAPELLAKIQEDARKEVDVKAQVDEAVSAERERVLGLTETKFGAEASAPVRKMAETGCTIEQFQAMQEALVSAESEPKAGDDKKKEILNAIEGAGTDDLGDGGKPKAGPATFMEAAKAIAEERGCKMSEAIKAARVQYPDLHDVMTGRKAGNDK